MLANYQSRIAAIPARETELVELTRDYETLRQVYTNLLAKSENARVSANLERRQIGEQFKILDPARLPERPISPDRPQINSMGAMAGLAVGLWARDAAWSIAIGASAPRAMSSMRFRCPFWRSSRRMMSIVERRRRRVRRWVVGLALGAAMVALVVGILVILRLGLISRWL